MTDHTLGLDLADLAAIDRLEPRTPLCDRCEGRHKARSVDACMASILARMQTLSYGKTAAYNSSGGGSDKAERVKPPGDSHPLHDKWWPVYDRAWDDERRHEVIRLALDELNRELRQHKQVEVADLEKVRLDQIAERTEGDRDTDVATAYGLTLPQVHRMRRTRDRDVMTGEPNKSEEAPDEDKLALARRMRSQGCSYRAIREFTGLPVSTLQRHLKAA